MRAELTIAFDALAPLCDVAAPLCEVATAGRLGIALELRSICTRVGLPQARAADVARALVTGELVGGFSKVSELTWRVHNQSLAGELAPLLRGAHMYRSRVHKDEDLVEVVLSKPPAPSQVARQLQSTLTGEWGLRETRQVLPMIAEAARNTFTIATPYLDEMGASIVLNLFEVSSTVHKCLILRETTEGLRPPGLVGIRASLGQMGVSVLNFRLDRADSSGNETFHAKVVLADDAAAYVGSCNMHRWSFEYPLKLGVLVRGRAAARIADVLGAVKAVALPM